MADRVAAQVNVVLQSVRPMTSLVRFLFQFLPRKPVVLASGRDSAFARAIAAHAPEAPIETCGDPLELESWMAQRCCRRIDLLLAERPASVGDIENLLFGNRIQSVLFPGEGGGAELAALLVYHQFSLFVETGAGAVTPVTPQQVGAGQEVLALQQRFVAPAVGVERSGAAGRGLDLPGLFQRLSLETRGAIHVGAVTPGEIDLYLRMGFRRVLVVEANPEVFPRVSALCRNRGNAAAAILCTISDRNGMEIFHAFAGGGSLLGPGAAEGNPRGPERELPLPARRLDFLLQELGQNAADYNFLRLDVHGAELRALRGAGDLLPCLSAVSAAISYEPRRPGAPAPEELDECLADAGNQRLFTATGAEHPQWGDAFYVRQPAVSMRKLGQWGRFGNQVFEYAFVKIFGRRHRLRVETSPWPGNQLFGACDPFPARQYPQHLESTYALADSQVARLRFRPANLDVCGVFQYHSSYYAPHKAYFRELLTPVPALKGLLDGALARVRAGARTLVALHLRRGDYGFGLFFVAPSAWYLDWLKALWPTLDAPALYIATDEPAKVLPDFAAYRPLAAADLKLPSFGADYYPDYYVLSQADHAAISNSSYSFSACMLNERGVTFMRPDLFAGRLLPFDPWNSEPLLHRELGILDQRQVAQLVPEYLKRPSDPQLANAVRGSRAQFAESFVQLRGDQIRLVLSMYFWGCYLDLRRANLRPVPLVDVEKRILERILGRLAQTAGLDAIGPYMAASLFLEPQKLPPVDLSPLPPDIQEVLRT